MGTLLNQPRRKINRATSAQLIDIIEECKMVSSIHDITLDQALQARRILEMQRKNDLYVDNGDIFDEQMSGFGELLIKFIDSFKDAFGVNNDSPSALEAIAIQLGFDPTDFRGDIISSLNNIADAITEE